MPKTVKMLGNENYLTKSNNKGFLNLKHVFVENVFYDRNEYFYRIFILSSFIRLFLSIFFWPNWSVFSPFHVSFTTQLFNFWCFIIKCLVRKNRLVWSDGPSVIFGHLQRFYGIILWNIYLIFWRYDRRRKSRKSQNNSRTSYEIDVITNSSTALELEYQVKNQLNINQIKSYDSQYISKKGEW